MTLDSTDARLAARLTELRVERAWSLEELARRTGVSRSTLSRLERREISPTAALLGRLCAAYGRTMSRLLAEVETAPSQVLRAAEQPVWTDEASGFVRRSVSPPHAGLRAELIEGVLRPGADIAYENPPVPGLEQHIWVQEGTVEVTVDGRGARTPRGGLPAVPAGGPSNFRCPGPGPVRYTLVVVLP